VTKELLECDAVVFFGSIRWGKMNAIYARLVERLTFLENRHSTLGESNLLKDIEAGVVSVGHNWNGEGAINLEREVLGFFGFKTPDELSWSYQWTQDANDESASGYKQDVESFEKEFTFIRLVKEAVMRFRDFIR
jgi:multimeric flavodoxin WrbA